MRPPGKVVLFSLLLLVRCSAKREPRVDELSPVYSRFVASLDVVMGPDTSDFQLERHSRATSFAVDTSKFIPPVIKNAVLDFGTLAVTTLNDTSLSTCGAGGNKRCTKAMLQLYTTGVLGPGIYNTADGYGSPLYSTLTTPLAVGLNQVNAAVMQSLVIASGKSSVRLRDFSPAPIYRITSDFTNAGKGTYQTTLVIEYATQ